MVPGLLEVMAMEKEGMIRIDEILLLVKFICYMYCEKVGHEVSTSAAYETKDTSGVS